MLEKKARGKDKVAVVVAAALAGRCKGVEAPGNADDVIVGLAKISAPTFSPTTPG